MAEPSASGVKIRKQSLEKLALPTMNGLDIVSIHEIIRCEADGNYTRVILRERKITTSMTLKEIEAKLKLRNFHRVHHHHLVNLEHAVKYIKGKGGQLELTNRETVTVSTRHKKNLMSILKDM